MTINGMGDALIKKMHAVEAWAINKTVSQVMPYALKHHPEWQNRTYTAEGSITQKQFATPQKRVALWGSVWGGTTFSNIRVSRRTGKLHTANYVWYLEFNRGSFLRGAADKIYPKLSKLVKAGFKRSLSGLKTVK